MRQLLQTICCALFVTTGVALFVSAGVLADTDKSASKPQPASKQQPAPEPQPASKQQPAPKPQPASNQQPRSEVGSTSKTQATRTAEDKEKQASKQAEKGGATSAAVAATTGVDTEAKGPSINKIVLAKGIDEGQPIEPGKTFSRADGMMFAFIYVENPAREETVVHVSWELADGPHWRGFPLSIPAKFRYRTVARTWTAPREPGIYKCVVSDETGTVLDEAEFQITE